VSPELALGLAGGSVADRLLGDPRRWHPVAGFGRTALALERGLWRPRRLAGAAYVGLLVGGVAAGAALADRALSRRPAARAAFTAVVTWCTLGGRSLGREARRLAGEVRAHDLPAARLRLPSLAGRDPAGLPGPELCRATVESVAENTADAVVGPLVWAALAGVPGAAAYRAANTLDAMVGHRTDRYRRFGWAAARLDDVLTWPAARLGAVLTVLLAPVGSRGAAWRALLRYGHAHPSPNAGQMEAAFSGALGVGLGGRNVYGTVVEDRPRIGDGPAPTPDDVDAAVRLAGAVGAAAACLSVAFAFVRPRLGAAGERKRALQGWGAGPKGAAGERKRALQGWGAGPKGAAK
jgi:adenosylcobinamide-phosphate synthase